MNQYIAARILAARMTVAHLKHAPSCAVVEASRLRSRIDRGLAIARAIDRFPPCTCGHTELLEAIQTLNPPTP